MYIKLLSVSRGSGEELLEDVVDYARQKGIKIWNKNDSYLIQMRRERWARRDKFGKWHLPLAPSNPSDPSCPVNYMVDILKRNNYLLDCQIKSLEEKFIQEGGYTENLFKKRVNYRNKL